MATAHTRSPASKLFCVRSSWTCQTQVISPSDHSVNLLAFATIANTVGVILLVTCLLIFKKVFAQASDEIPKLPYDLFPGGGGATGPIVRIDAYSLMRPRELTPAA